VGDVVQGGLVDGAEVELTVGKYWPKQAVCCFVAGPAARVNAGRRSIPGSRWHGECDVLGHPRCPGSQVSDRSMWAGMRLCQAADVSVVVGLSYLRVARRS